MCIGYEWKLTLYIYLRFFRVLISFILYSVFFCVVVVVDGVDVIFCVVIFNLLFFASISDSYPRRSNDTTTK